MGATRSPASVAGLAAAMACVACSPSGESASGSTAATSAAGPTGTGASSAQSSGTSGSGGAGGGPVTVVCDGGASPGLHVAPDGAPTGDGTTQSPLDLATALGGSVSVAPGSTIWLHGGVYHGGFVAKLDGSDADPITVRSYPGEWATIDGAGTDQPALQIYHHDAVFRDFEITSSDPERAPAGSRPSGIYVEGKNIKLVNLVVHDVGTGIICNSASDATPELAPELEVYGTILYDNGWDAPDRGHGHDLYLQNRDGTKHLRENLTFNNFGGFGFHLYSETDAHFVEGYEITGNAWWNAGVATAGLSKVYDGFLVGHNGTHPAARVELRENMGYAHPSDDRDVRLGWGTDNQDAKLFDNYLVGQVIFQNAWATIEMTGNTFFGAPLAGVDPAAFPANTYATTRPTGAKVFVRPNAYQPGRAHVVVYNWDLADTVDVDLGAVVPVGAAFEVRNAQDYFAKPVVTGTFAGGPIALPMKGLSVAQPIGAPTAIEPSETTGAELNAFVVISSCAP